MIAKSPVLALVAAVLLGLGSTSPAHASRFEEASAPVRGALYLGSAVLTPPYAALRAGVLLGATGLAGAVAFISLGTDRETPNTIIEEVSAGEWWVEPRHLTGEKQLRLPGR